MCTRETIASRVRKVTPFLLLALAGHGSKSTHVVAFSDGLENNRGK